MPPDRLIFLDETGSHISMTRAYARALVGERIAYRLPRNRGVVTTIIGALSARGVQALMTCEGGTSRDVFLTFLREHLAPTLRPGDVLVMDNLGAHHASGVADLVAERGATIIYMPPYSPDLNPIELCWSKLKALLRTIGARTRERLHRAVAAARTLISPADAEGWFRHCGVHQPT